MRITPWLAVIPFCVLLSAREISPDLFNGLHWRLIGPFRGGRAVAVCGVPGGGATFYFGAVDGGVWKTTDAGTVWTPLFDSQPVGSIGALAVAPSDPNIIYAGTGESDIRSDLASGDGVYKSLDGGKTWKNIGLTETRQISRVVVDPRDPNVVFVAALGHAYASNPERGIYFSKDGGATWKHVLDKGPEIGAADLAMATDQPNILFAALWQAHRPPWSTYAPLTGPGSGLFRSTDKGTSWQQVSGKGFPEGPLGRIGVAISPGTHGRRIYAAVEASADKAGVYRSDDGGNSWTRVNNDSRLTSRGWYFSSITADPDDPDVLYIPNVAFYKLTDGGKTLSIIRGAPGGDDYHQVWIDPGNNKHMALASDQGTTVTLNGGETWSTWYNQPTAQFYHVVTDNEVPYHVYGAQQDSGTAATAASTTHGQIDLRDWFSVGGSESGYIAPDPKNPDIFYLSETYGSVGRLDRRTMQTQNITPWPLPMFGTEISQRKYRDPWTPVLVFSPTQQNALYLGTQYVLRTLDGGLHWQQISPDLTGAQTNGSAAAQSKDPVTVANAEQQGYGVVYTIAPSQLAADEIWAGSDTGLVHLTRDAGKNWTNVTPPGLSAWSKITQIEASHFTAGEAYAAVDRHRLDDQRPYLYRTRDFGKTWAPIVSGIADHAFLNAIREDPKRRGLLFAGTEFGVYVSFDDGDQWLPLQLNLPVTSIRDLAIHNDDLIAGTHGRSFWVLDDIASLREISAQPAADDVRLYKPATAIRMSSDGFVGTPLPPDDPQAGNPPIGAYIDYYLPGAASTPVILEVLNANGKPIRHISSQDKPPAPSANLPIAPRWVPKPQTLGTEPGMHRFIWDLRFGRSGDNTTADSDDSDEETWVGPLVLPGSYTVKLSVGGHTYTQPLRVVMDSRIHATPADLAEQFHWARRAFDDMVQARESVLQLKALQTSLDKLRGQIGSDQQRLLASVSAAKDKSGAILDGGKEGPEKGLQSASRSLTIVLSAIESADRTPPSQVIELYRESAVVLKARLAEWTQLKVAVVPELNRQLQSAGFAPVQLSMLEQVAEESLSK
ncbi:MAG: hypothetical protein JOY54_17420 [Acidobacteriaceae bacterium]|nr:hypothetical protein [Acidobacteriaceae bacterium]